MKAVEFSGNPRAWRIRGLEKNREFYESLPFEPFPDWSNPNVLVGNYVLGELDHCVTCLLARREELAAAVAEHASKLVASAWAAISDQEDRDLIFIDRPMIAVAARVGRCLFPPLFEQNIEVPFGAFKIFVEDPETESVERVVACLVWALLGCLENRPEQLVQSKKEAGKAPKELKPELDLLPQLEELMQDRNSSQWRNLEEALATWRDPAISQQKPRAAVHRRLILAVLALFWSRFRHEQCERDVMMKAILGP